MGVPCGDASCAGQSVVPGLTNAAKTARTGHLLSLALALPITGYVEPIKMCLRGICRCFTGIGHLSALPFDKFFQQFLLATGKIIQVFSFSIEFPM